MEEKNKILQIKVHALEHENKELALKNKDLLYLNKELNHRVKNNLLAISAHTQSILRKLKKGKVFNPIDLFQDILSRVQSVLLLTIQMEKPNASNKINIQEYISQLLFYLQQNANYPKGSFLFDIHLENAPSMALGKASRLGMVLTELILNAVKHVDVPDKRLNIIAVFENKQFVFKIQDNGKGIPEKAAYNTGLEMVELVVEKQLKGRLSLDTSTNGTAWTIFI